MADNKIDSPNTVFPNGDDLLKNVASQGSSIFSIKPMAKYLSGARCVLRLNGNIVGFAFGVSWKIQTSVNEIRTIDDYMPYELAPKHISVDGTISGFRIPGFGPGVELLQTDILNFLQQRYIEIEVRDSQTDNLIFLTRRALITGRNESIKSNQLADMSLTFKSIGWADERAPEKVKDNFGTSTEASASGPVESLKSTITNIKNGIPSLGTGFDPSNIV